MTEYIHQKTGKKYQTLHQAFDVHKQCRVVIYIQLETGMIFSRGYKSFMNKFVRTCDDPFDDIQVKDRDDI